MSYGSDLVFFSFCGGNDGGMSITNPLEDTSILLVPCSVTCRYQFVNPPVRRLDVAFRFRHLPSLSRLFAALLPSTAHSLSRLLDRRLTQAGRLPT